MESGADNKNISKWESRHIIAAVSIMIMLYIAVILIFAPRLQADDNIMSLFSFSISLIAIYYLNSKYPIKLFSPFNIKNTFKFVIGGVLVCAFLNFPYDIWAGAIQKIPEEYLIFSNYDLGGKFIFLSGMILFAPILEELLFRGFFYRILKNRYDIFWGALISTALFVLFHNFPPNVFIALPSLIYTYIYEKSNTIWGSILTHSLDNTLRFLFVYWGLN